MPLPERHDFRQFLLFVFALLIPCFVLWTFISAALITPAIGVVHLMLSAWFPDVVGVLFQQGADALLMTRFAELGPVPVVATDAESSVGFRINTRILSYSIPFYTALHFATHKQDYLAQYLWGLLLLYSLIVFGLLCLCLKELMVNLGATFFEQPGVFVPAADVIGILYQLNVLIIPTLAPALLWVGQSRDTPLFRNLLEATGITQVPTQEG